METISKIPQDYKSSGTDYKSSSTEAKLYYNNRITALNSELKIVQKKYRLFTFLRLLFFLLAANSLFVFWGSSLLFPAFLIGISLFLYVVHLSVDAKYKRDKTLALIQINEHELTVLTGDWSMFEDGAEFRNGQHPFSLDMDVFGKKSVFQLLNRTVSNQGKNKLAATLSDGTSEIEMNTTCISELSEHIDWCQEFMSEGIVRKGEAHSSLKDLEKMKFQLSKTFLFLRYLLPVTSLLSIVLLSIGILSSTQFSIILVLILSVIAGRLKSTNAISQSLANQSDRIKVILNQLKLYSELNVKNERFKKEQDLLLNEGNGVLHEVKELDKIMNRFDVRINFLVGMALNFLIAWDFQILVQLKKWLDKNKQQLVTWEDKLAEIEVWISGAIYKFNHPNSTFAVINQNDESIEITGLSHPFVDQTKSVLNDVILDKQENFIIITGPNMAGKSTYLRSLGLTFIFANAGFPILAKSCKIPLLKLFSSMRTSDDLTVESSYFHAELIRLRFIMDAIERGEKVFIILDEILKGTNSKDKEIGSAKFLQKLKRLNAKGIIATHDLSLCELAEGDSSFKNMYFDSTINGDNLSFDYKINKGVCQNMNASFLLKQMNLVD